MAAFNRNIITQLDVDNLQSGTVPVTFDVAPPAAAGAPAKPVVPEPPAVGAPAAPRPADEAKVPIPTADDFLTKLLKYVPLEILGLYLFVAGVIDTNVEDPSPRAWWLGVLLFVTLLVSIPYAIRVLSVKRVGQIAMSLVGLSVYVFSIGGWFATTTWYETWYASIALPIFSVLVGIVKLKPLPVAA